jgi:hypothetical protein
MSEPTSSELTAELLALIRDQPHPDSGEHPIWRWQRWIKDDPERAWEVFELAVQQAPDEPDVLESVRYNLQILLSKRWADFSERAVALVQSAPLLDIVIGPEILTRENYGPRYRSLDELATVWVRQNSHSDASHRVTDIMRKDPKLGIRLALEIIERGPLHSFEVDDLHSPLLDLLWCHGADVIAELEAAARESEAVRRVLWDARRLNPQPDRSYSISSEVWQRAMRAAGTTNLYNSAPPEGRRRSLGAELDELLDRWFISEECFWAWSEVHWLIDEEPAKGWEAIQALLRHATSDEALGSIGAGSLEDLIGHHPADFIEPIERLAAENERFRRALAGAWLELKDVPEDLTRRYWIASGKQLRVLDAPAGWDTAEGAS